MRADVFILLAASLRADSSTNGAIENLTDAQILGHAREHGVVPLLHQAVVQGSLLHLSGETRAAVRKEARQQGIITLLQEEAVRPALRALSEAGLEPLLMKGAALAYSHYAAPHLRPRCDTDLLVRDSERAAAAKVLCALGYLPQNAVEGELVSYQRVYVETGSHIAPHAIDLHWRLTNPQRFANLLRHEDLRRESVPVPQLGPAARALGPRHALWLACVHRVAHHGGTERLIWLYDIRLLVNAMCESELDSFADLAAETRVAGICADGLRTAACLFEIRIPDAVLERLQLAAAAEPDFLRQSARRWHALQADLSALPTWRQRIRLLREHLLPPAEYMLRRHGNPPRALLPALYLWRATGAVRKLALPHAPGPPAWDTLPPPAAVDR